MQPLAVGRYLAANIPDAELLEVEGEDHFCFTTPNWHELTTRLSDFLCGVEADDLAQGAFAAPFERPALASAGRLAVREREATLSRQGAVWTVGFRGRSFGVPHVRGLCDLHYLVLHPQVDVHITERDAAGAEPAASRSGPRRRRMRNG